MNFDAENAETWKNLRNISPQDRKAWIKAKLPIIMRTLERYAAMSVDYQNHSPWDMIGYVCLNDGLYKEAEHIYDDVSKKAKDRNKIISHLMYCRGIARFFQGRYKDAYEDFKLSSRTAYSNRRHELSAIKAVSYMEETIFPMLEMVAKTKKQIRNDLNIPRFIDKSVGANILKTLHKWNSCTSLFSSGISQGGGYLLTLRDHLGEVKSIAIDPGYEFIELFRDLDLSIVDLDAIIVTHDHDDHTESIEAILSLLAKHNDHCLLNKIKILDIFGAPGVMLKYQGLFNSTDPHGNREIRFKLLIPGVTIDHLGSESLMEKYGCILHVKQAFHKELWTHEESAVGIVIETNILDKSNIPVRIGITGDSRYEPGFGLQYKGCQVLLFNIGSLEKEEGLLLPQHLGLIGSINTVKEAMPKIAILTEFGEEFRGKRATVSSVIEEWASPMGGESEEANTKIFPADIHFELRLNDLNVKETSSKVFLPYRMIEVDESESDTIIYKMKENKRDRGVI